MELRVMNLAFFTFRVRLRISRVVGYYIQQITFVKHLCSIKTDDLNFFTFFIQVISQSMMADIPVLSSMLSQLFESSKVLDDVSLHHLVDALCRLSMEDMENATQNKVRIFTGQVTSEPPLYQRIRPRLTREIQERKLMNGQT